MSEILKTCQKCNRGPTRVRHGLCRSCITAAQKPQEGAQTPAQAVQADREIAKVKAELLSLRSRYNEALKTIEGLEADLRVSKELAGNVDFVTIEPKVLGQGTNEGTVVLVASDWHVEELVGPEVGGLNRYDPEIAALRAREFFRSGLRLTQLLQKDIAINHMVLPLLGDFISGDIHGAESTELNAEAPMHAIVTAQNHIISGIEFLLDHSKLELTIPCHSGNHARQTQTTRFSAENGHSLEYLMYRHLESYFRGEKRIRFIIPPGMHSYVEVYGKTIRFQHGHAIKYSGGVGGIYIPVNKALDNWNKGRRADLDVFGHFHQLVDGGRFICNGSLIGYNGFALSIKAPYERPKQALFLMDRKRQERTCLWPILFNEEAK